MNWAANWTFQRSLMRVFLMAERSQLLTSGARTPLNAANWTFQRSLMRVFLMAERSQLLTSGARTPLNADDSAITLDASCWLDTRLNAAGLNHCATLRCPDGRTT